MEVENIYACARSLIIKRQAYTWLQVCDVYMTCRPDDVSDHHVTDQLDVRQSQYSTVGDRSFAVAAWCSTMEQSAT